MRAFLSLSHSLALGGIFHVEQDGVNFTWLSIVFCFRQPLALWLVCILLSSVISLQLKHIAAGANWFSMSFVLRVFYIIYFVALWYVIAVDKMCLSLHFFPLHILGNDFLWLFAVFCTLFWRWMCLRLFIYFAGSDQGVCATTNVCLLFNCLFSSQPPSCLAGAIKESFCS